MKVRFEDKKLFSSKIRSVFIPDFFSFWIKNSAFLVPGFKMKQVFLPKDCDILLYFKLERLTAVCKLIFEDH